MKLDRNHYVLQGQTAAKENAKLRGLPLKTDDDNIPVYGLGASWQAKAFRAGYVEEANSLNAMVSGDDAIIDAINAKSLESAAGYSPFPLSMPEGTRAHIQNLIQQMGSETDGARLVRLQRKTETLYARWA